jgi:hypothetical protein
LTFHIDCEPLYPDVWSTIFDLEATLSGAFVKDDTGDIEILPLPIHEVDDGAFTLMVAQPDVELKPDFFCEYKVGMLHTIEFWLSNINKVYGFGLVVSYNASLLEGDVQSIVISDCFPPPYEYLHMEQVVVAGIGYFYIEVVRPCEKPTVTHCEGPIVTFSLTSIYDFPDNMIPLCANDTITLVSAYVLAKCGCDGTGATVQYDYPGTLALTGSGNIEYYWRPRIGDLNLDGAVDIQDLQALAAVYGMDFGLLGWGNLDNVNTVVDIFDFVVIAKFFGKPYECHIAWDGCWPN